jgi:HEAT repeat protein
MGLFGPPDIDKLEAKGDVEGLVKSLNYRRKDSHVRWRAAGALGKIGDSRAVEPLIAALKDENSRVRQYAAEALRKIGPACPFSQ